MKLSDVVKDGVKDLEAQLREIRRNEEDDLGKLADSFDAVAKAADLVAAKIANAETALGEDPGEDEPKAETED